MTALAMRLASALAIAVSVASGPIVSLPGKAWHLSLDLSGFSMVEDENRPDGSARKLRFKHEDGRTNLTVVMKPAAAEVSASSVRDERWQRLQEIEPPESDGTLWVEQDRAYFQYFSEFPFQGVPLHQKHIHTFIIHEGTRIEVHVSVTRFAEKDQPWLDTFQRSIKVASAQPET